MVKQLAQEDMASKWQSQHLSPCSLTPAPLLCVISSFNLDILGLRRVMAGIRKKKNLKTFTKCSVGGRESKKPKCKSQDLKTTNQGLEAQTRIENPTRKESDHKTYFITSYCLCPLKN